MVGACSRHGRYEDFTHTFDRKIRRERPRTRCQNNIKMDLQEM
jgi:hypothetical protein